MRTYIAHDGKLDALSARFREHTLKLFEKHGMTNVGYWFPTTDGTPSADTIVYLLSYPDRAAADRSWAAFRADPEWVEVRKVTEKDGQIVKQILSVFLAPADFSPLK